VLYISGIGYYEASLNGEKVGDHFFWTRGGRITGQTVSYNSFDVTAALKKGRNCLGVELGNGLV